MILAYKDKGREKNGLQRHNQREKVKGKWIKMANAGAVLMIVHPANQITCAHKDGMLPQKLAITSATRSEWDRSALVACSNRAIVSTFCLVISSTVLGL
jgi:hypothetical protein